MRYVILGSLHSSGIGKETGKAYDNGTLFIGKSIRGWENERGKGVANGLEPAKIDFLKTPEMVKKVDSTVFPCLAEVALEPSPEDPNKNIVIGFDVIVSLFDNLHEPKVSK
ncbi:RstB phage-related integrase [Vibrio vulnificus]|uniref:hypothetical protein n=1 Tax=Vibrio vulnificus TaxID=672 RepID=UPI0004F84C2F|nr:hypothetical protein [Vibrio vulnificus]AIL70639.1 RstB phage-related integrase [Vibrio vulnificus]AIL72842.1 RstB phage-related integrase [Vibrio vulnificus]PWY26925.1 hypothetical protein VV97_22560 [Vibrio vulnificus]